MYVISQYAQFKKEWAQVPEVLYLTIKAMHNHNQQIQQNLYRQKQLITEQSVMIKQISVEIQQLQLGLKSNRKWENNVNQNMNGFKKSKPSVSSNRIGQSNSYRYGSIKSSRHKQGSPNSIKQQKSISFQKKSNSQIIEQIKLIQDGIRSYEQFQKSQLVKNKKIDEQIQLIKSQLQRNIKQRQIGQIKQQLSSVLKQQIKQMEITYSKKLQNQRSNIMRFAQETAIQMQKMFIQINNIHIKISEITQQNSVFKTKQYIKQANTKNHQGSNQNNLIMEKKQKYEKQVQKQRQKKQGSQQKYTILFKDYNDFKFKILKQITSLVKSESLQNLFSNFQSSQAQKLKKMNKKILEIQKQLETTKKLLNHSSKQTIENQQQQQINKNGKDKSGQNSLLAIQESLKNVENHFKQKLKSSKKQIIAQLNKSVNREIKKFHEQIQKQLQIRQNTLCDIVQKNCDKINKSQSTGLEGNSIIQLKNSISRLAEQMILSRYIHLGHTDAKQHIEWQKNVYNSMQENFVWKNNSHVVTVMAAGLYRVQAGLFTDNQVDKIQGYIVLNGVSVCQLKNKQVPAHTLAPARGSLFNEAMLLPAKSKIWIKIKNQFFGQAYLQIQKM